MRSTAAAPASSSPTKSLGKFKRRMVGHTPLAHRTVFYNLSRLTAGKTQLLCVLYVLSETEGAARSADTPAPAESAPISTDEFGWFCNEKSIRTVQAALDDLCERKVLVRRMAKRGEYHYSAPVGTWEKLPSFLTEKKPVDSAESLDSAEDDSSDTGEEQANLRRRKLRLSALNDKPLALAAGRPSKAFELSAPVDGKQKPVPIEKVQFDCNAPAQVDPIMHRGILRISIRMGSSDTRIKANAGRTFNAENCVETNGLVENSELDGVLAQRAGPLKAAVKSRELWTEEHDLWRDALNRWFRPALGPVEDEIVRQAVAQHGRASMGDCLNRLRIRSQKGFCKTWGGVVLVIRETADAAAKAGTNGHPSERDRRNASNLAEMLHRESLDSLRTALRFVEELPDHPDAALTREYIEGADPELVKEARKSL